MAYSFLPRTTGLVLAVAALTCGASAILLLPRSFPLLSIEHRITGSMAVQRADSFARIRSLSRVGMQSATRFSVDEKLLVFLDLSSGPDAVRAVLRGKDYALYQWHVRRFTPGDVHETKVSLAPDGRIVGFKRTLSDSDSRTSLSIDSARALANEVREEWLNQRDGRWRLISTSYERKAVSGRLDRTFTFERTDVRYGGAPLRLGIVIGGDVPLEAFPSVLVPEAFERRFAEMRASNARLGSLALIGQVLLFLAVVLSLRRYALDGGIRWRPALASGALVGALLVASGLNGLPLGWYDYDTTTSAHTFVAQSLIALILQGVLIGLLIGLTIAAAEAAWRRAFPEQLDWWRWWEARGTRHVAGRVLGGYAIAAFGLFYVSAFYLFTRKIFGWWTPSELIDNPNLIGTRLPWLAGLAQSLQAGVWEEALFRVLPLALLASWARDRTNRSLVMLIGVLGTSLVFSFAHSSYLSWPAYSRGVELFLESSLWAAVVLAFGPLPTVLGHFLYDFFLFNLFAGAGTGHEYSVTAAVAMTLALAPGIAVLWKVVREGALTDIRTEQLFGAWKRAVGIERLHHKPVIALRPLTVRARAWAMIAGLVSLAVTILEPTRPVRGPRITASRVAAQLTADSAMAARGVSMAGWTHLSRYVVDTVAAWPRFLRAHRAESLAVSLAATIQPAGWWLVRYVRPREGIERRAEEWRLRVWPDGRLLDVWHVLPDAAWRDSVSDREVRSLALAALTAVTPDTLRYVEAEFVVDKKSSLERKEQRKDVTITYTDAAVHLPGGALARAWVSIAGNEVTRIRRGVQLPEAFTRVDRKREALRDTVGGALMCILIGFFAASIAYVRSRRQDIREDRPLGVRGLRIAAAMLLVVSAALLLNQLPRTLAGYDTAIPWRGFIIYTGLILVIPLTIVGVLVGIWLAFDGLRRRVGVPFVARGAESWNATIVAGVGLAGTLTAVTGVLRWLSSPHVVPAPMATTLDTAIPSLEPLLNLPFSISAGVMVPALLLFVVLLLVRRALARAALLTVITVFGGSAMMSLGWLDFPRTHLELFVVVLLGSIAACSLALRAFASSSAMVWFVSGIIVAALDSVRNFLQAVAPFEKSGALLAFAACGGLLLLARRYVTRNTASSSEDHSAGPSGNVGSKGAFS